MLDFGSGSGLAGIAAAMAGASSVVATDIDSFALTAMALNAAANNVTLEIEPADLVGTVGDWDVILAGDVCYERDMATSATAWLEALALAGATVLIGDPGRAYLPKDRLEALAVYQVATTRELEDSEVKRTTVWRFASRLTAFTPPLRAVSRPG